MMLVWVDERKLEGVGGFGVEDTIGHELSLLRDLSTGSGSHCE